MAKELQNVYFWTSCKEFLKDFGDEDRSGLFKTVYAATATTTAATL